MLKSRSTGDVAKIYDFWKISCEFFFDAEFKFNNGRHFMTDWVREHFVDEYSINWVSYYGNPQCVIYTKSSADVMLFKLTWK